MKDTWLAWGIMILLSTTSSSLSSLPYPKQTLLRHEVTVTLKLVQVFVMDRKGNPVQGLKKDDFLVFDEGQKQSVTEFEEHVLFLPSKKEKSQPELMEPPRLLAHELMPRKFFLFFDFAYNNGIGLEKAREAALHFIDTQVQPRDEVGLISYSAMKSLKLHEYLTTDHHKVRQSIKELGMKQIVGRAEDFEAEYWQAVTGENLKDASSSGWVDDKPDARLVTLKRKESENQTLHFVDKISDLSRALRYIQGHKHIVFFSSGVPYSLIYGIQVAYGHPDFVDMGNPVLKFKFEEMLRELNAANCSVYPLDTQELRGILERDTSTRGSYTLQKMANATGGKYFGNINSYEQHLEKIQRITGSYYVLGYYVDEQWDGKYHQIKVEVNRAGCKVYAQKGYFNPKPFKDYTDLERMLHLVDLALSENPLFQTPLRFPLKAIPCTVRGKQHLALWARVEKEKIEPIAARKVEVVTILFDTNDNIVKMERKERDLSTLPEGPLYLSSFIPLAPGEYKCRLIVRNLETGRGAVASSSVSVPEQKAGELRLTPPLLLREEKDSSYFQVSRTPLDFPFDRTRYAPLLEDVEAGTANLYAVVRCDYSRLENPEARLLGNLLRYEADTSTAIPASISILESRREGETEVFLLKIQPETLEPGEYVLYLFAEELKTGARSQVNTSFKVK